MWLVVANGTDLKPYGLMVEVGAVILEKRPGNHEGQIDKDARTICDCSIQTVPRKYEDTQQTQFIEVQTLEAENMKTTR